MLMRKSRENMSSLDLGQKRRKDGLSEQKVLTGGREPTLPGLFELCVCKDGVCKMLSLGSGSGASTYSGDALIEGGLEGGGASRCFEF